MKSKLTVLCLFLILASVQPAKYLSEKPSFVTPCVHGTPGFGSCFAANFQVLFKEWKDGIPGLKNVGKLDPLDIKRVRISQDTPNNIIVIHAELTNVVVKGASKGIIKSASLNKDTLVTTVQLFLPKLRFDMDYRAKGRVLALTLNGSGRGYFDAENIAADLEVAQKIRHEHGEIFTDVTHVTSRMKDVGSFRIHLGNLFNGQKDLEDSANALFNENWRDFYAVLKPAIQEVVAAVLEDRFKKVFAYVPGSYFVANLE